MEITETKSTKWTRFMDMHSGGSTKEDPFEYIYIEAPEKEAITIFFNRFKHNPSRVTCTCCGDDYSINEEESLQQATAYERGCNDKDGKYIEEPRTSEYSDHVWTHTSLEDYLKKETVLVIRKEDIEYGERFGFVPEQGYMWRD